MRPLHKRLTIVLALSFIVVYVASVYAVTVEVDNLRYWSSYTRKPITGYVQVRSAAVLTNSYVDTNVVRLDHFKNIALALDITKGSLTSIEYIVWWSKDGSTWYQEVTEAVGAGIITHTLAYYTKTLVGNERFFAPMPFLANYLKLQVKGTGTVTGSSCAIAVFGAYGG